MSSPDENVQSATVSEPQKPAAPKKPKKPAAKKAKAPAKKVKAKAPAKKTAAKKTAKPKKAAAKHKAKKAAKTTKRGQGTKFIDGPLYQMIKKALPKKFITTDGVIDMKLLAPAVKTSMEGVYKWFRTNHVAPDKAMRLMKASLGKLKHRDFDKFVYPAK
mgnify:CR=1 FL=1